MLLNNDKHRRWHSLGPKDCKWPGAKKAVTSISVTRSTIDNEQMSIAIPVFCDDTREDLSDRLGMMLSVVQERLDESAEAWREVRTRAEEANAAKKEGK